MSRILHLADRLPPRAAAPDLPEEVAAVVREIQGSTPAGAPLPLLRRRYAEIRRALGPEPPVLASLREETIPGPGGPLRLRLYRPSFSWKPVPALLFLHGGGWTVGDLDSHDTLCRQLALATGQAVVAVDYRLSPEHPFPAALDDARAALSWLVEHARLLAIDPAAIGLAGDSAGGNLAAVLALEARDRGYPAPACQILVYPALDLVATAASHQRRAEGYLLDRDTYLGWIGNYLGRTGRALDWRVSPLRADRFDGLPPTVIVTAGFDPLLDEGRAYAGRLAEAGVPIIHLHEPTMIHGFLTMGGRLPAANRTIAAIGRALAGFDVYGLRDGAGI
ncbi:MAG: hypothetical protein RLY86_2581 [Pseudomonadota bacterium]|jgi:acetyl esterase